MKAFKITLMAGVLAAALGHAVTVTAAVKESVFAQQYQPVAAVNSQQAQVVFYRGQDSDTRGAHIYVDGELQSSLLPKGYTVFCVSPGKHALGSFIGDAPLYKGKEQQAWRTLLAAGKTYFLRVGSGASGNPELRARPEAEEDLKEMRLQRLMLNRASATQQCQYLKEYSLSSDILFAFGKSSAKDISHDGQQIVRDLVAKIRKENATIRNIQVVGHTDPIGSAQSNEKLGQRRAETVRAMIVQNGIPANIINATSEGSRNLLITECRGTKAQKISCYAPNRRVSIIVEGTNNP